MGTALRTTAAALSHAWWWNACTILLFVLPLTAGEQRLPHYGVKVEMVDIFATVHDGRGRLVTSLRQDDFVIYDNGVAQNITRFSKEYMPLSVLVLLDTSASMSGVKLDYARKSLSQFLRRLNRGDEAMLMTFHARPRIVQGYTTDLNRIRRALKPLDGNGSTALYDAILAALEEAPKSKNRRRTLLLISDGINTYGRSQLAETVNRLRRRGVELFAIGIAPEHPEDERDRVITGSVLSQLTQSAGGEAFVLEDPRDLGAICATISDRMHNQYTFGYYPAHTKAGEYRSISIVTRTPGLRVIPSKTGYYPAPHP